MNTINGIEIKTIDDYIGFSHVATFLLFGEPVEINGKIYREQSDYEAVEKEMEAILADLV